MIVRTVCIENPSGLHARLASLFCAKAKQYRCQIVVRAGRQYIPARNILDMMAANIRQGQCITIHCEGEDEAWALADLVAFLTSLTE
ncbi:MAG: HPr family phosphocarrier protein [Clostridia bacterium]|nr:HPr family phosphocarrier protein [Clostridia bacterium]NCC76123.1 HPr family phosphocarrier protein [Clostridia bacterium]